MFPEKEWEERRIRLTSQPPLVLPRVFLILVRACFGFSVFRA
jgi:hypothetical protein